jgi:radical SAM superfamily enzyme YgiQ (UPF0313 family)
VRCYDLEVKADFVGGFKEESEQFARDIVKHISDFAPYRIQENELIRPSKAASPVFLRLYPNLVDKDDTLQQTVELLRKKYTLQRVVFELRSQDC